MSGAIPEGRRHFQDRSARELNGLVSTAKWWARLRKGEKKGLFSGQNHPMGLRLAAKSCDFRGVMITTQYMGIVYHVVDSVVLERKNSLKKRIFWGGGVVLRFWSSRRAGAADIDRTEAWHTFIVRCPREILRKRGCLRFHAFDSEWGWRHGLPSPGSEDR